PTCRRLAPAALQLQHDHRDHPPHHRLLLLGQGRLTQRRRPTTPDHSGAKKRTYALRNSGEVTSSQPMVQARPARAGQRATPSQRSTTTIGNCKRKNEPITSPCSIPSSAQVK